MRTATDRLDVIAFLAALCLFLSTLEYVIPKPIPFLRLGLANLPILISLPYLPVPSLLLLVLLKVLGQALVQGSLYSYVFLFSLSGSFASGTVMILLSRLAGRSISLIGISVMGALASNACQTLLAVFLVFGKNGWLIAPILMGVGLASSLLLGLFAEKFVRTSRWVKETLIGTHSTV
jgi:heptaprenyl diphosphate synthase